MRNKFVAALLAFIGGTIGLHKFYLRETGSGVFYIFLTIMSSRIFPISTVLSFIDGIRYLTMPQHEFDRKFNSRHYRDKPSQKPQTRQRQQEYYEVKPVNQSSKTRRSVRDNPFKRSGIKKYKDYEIEEAIEDFEKALKIEPNDVALFFNLACAHSLLENKEQVFKYLDAAVRNGFQDYDRILSHDDLAYIRIQPEFDAFKKNGFKISPEVTPANEELEKSQPLNDVLLAQLNRLMELRKKGILTEHEFSIERKKVLSAR